MTSYFDLKDFLLDQKYHLYIAADAQPFLNKRVKGTMTTQVAAGGVSVALEPVARAGNAVFISRGKTIEDKEILDKNGIITVNHKDPYTLRRIFLPQEDLDGYYNGFSNQTLWPLCHVAFETPIFSNIWYEKYKKVNSEFAHALETTPYNGAEKAAKVYFINDYQLSLVPSFLKKTPETIISLFWHIPWPTWEVFRILPQKKEILQSLLQCDFLAFHRDYHVRNFFSTLRRELAVRIDEEKKTVHFGNHATVVKSLPMGIDTDVIKSLSTPEDSGLLTHFIKSIFRVEKEKIPHEDFFNNTKVILGVDRLDYTKGLTMRLTALERFLEKYPRFLGNVSYVGFLALSRENIPSYQMLKKTVREKAREINKRFGTKQWKPVHLLPGVFSRQELISLYTHAAVCLVTPLDDGMNLVSKEFVIASSTTTNPGALVLSQFAGSATDLTSALIVNAYDTEETADAIAQGLSMDQNERKERIMRMAATLEEQSVYAWSKEFLRQALAAAKENRGVNV